MPERKEVWRPLPATFTARPCKRCARPITLVPTDGARPNGKPSYIPLDLVPIKEQHGGALACGDRGCEQRQLVVYIARSHFETCPHAAEFSRGKR